MRTLDTSEAGLIELAGDAPKWIWAFTCPTPGCDCRTAIVLSTDGDRQTLVARGSPVRDAWLRGESHSKAAAALDGIAAFAINIDEGCVFPAYGATCRGEILVSREPLGRRASMRVEERTPSASPIRR